MSENVEPLIRVKNLSKVYDDHPILKNISFSIESGDLVSIIGPSGCGKSTLLRCLNCLEILDEGEISINGTSISSELALVDNGTFLQRAHQLRQSIGMVFQSFNLFPHKTLLENIMLAPMVVKKQSRELSRKQGMELLNKVGLSNLYKRHPWSISGGQKQRVAIARALAMNPILMLYDEPTSALDPEMVEEVLQVMRNLDKDGMTQVIVSHEMKFARDASDYIIYIEDGQVIEISDEDEIFISPKDERTKRFLKRYM
ncbi:MAG: amino acid ABC transporter ATP-binding protein [Puniceicoccales bacterium]|jgi:polar amino acid transport system ATP-binding protein|nr:amino acid ABC transporter ATP-binding protein [Puniceicoccales bacterium]